MLGVAWTTLGISDIPPQPHREVPRHRDGSSGWCLRGGCAEGKVMDVHMFKAWSIRLVCVLAMPCLATLARGQESEFPSSEQAGSFVHPSLISPFDDSDATNENLERPLSADVLYETGPTIPYFFTFTPRFLVGPVSGFTQVPKGGSEKSSDHQRPRLSELGIHDALIPDLELAVRRGPHEVYAGIQIIRLTGTQSLRQELVTNGVTFAKNKRVRSDVDLDWYRLGYRYSIPLFQGADGVPRLMLVPQAELVWWTFEYRMFGANGTTSTGATKLISTKKSLDYFTGRAGASLEWRPFGGAISLEGKLMADPKVDDFPFVATEEFLFKYRMLESKRYGLTVHAGVQFEQMDFNSGGTPRSTHIKADFGPLFDIGANVNF